MKYLRDSSSQSSSKELLPNFPNPLAENNLLLNDSYVDFRPMNHRSFMNKKIN